MVTRFEVSQRTHRPEPYHRQAGGSQGIDVFKQNLDGSEKQVELGFERVELGPTTNFVGNAMTTGAEDMVKALLQFQRRTPDMDNENENSEGPRLLKGPEELEAARASAEAVAAQVNTICATQAANSTLPSKHQLRVLGYMEGANGTDVIMLERPHTDDPSCQMTMKTWIKPTHAEVEFDIEVPNKDKSSEPTVLKRYYRKIDGLGYKINVDESTCTLAGGDAHEIMCRALDPHQDIKNRVVWVNHGCGSTVICFNLVQVPRSDDSMFPTISKKLIQPLGSLNLSVPEERTETDLSALKSYIRRARKIANPKTHTNSV